MVLILIVVLIVSGKSSSLIKLQRSPENNKQEMEALTYQGEGGEVERDAFLGMCDVFFASRLAG